MALPSVNCLSICAGVGGLDLGLQLAHDYLRTPFRGVCFVEIEAAAAASLVASMEAGWFHPAPIWSDARTFDGTAFRGCVDIVTSGDPCQGNSVAGKRLGQLDDRWLLDRAIDIYDQSGAATFFRENVPGNADGQLAVAIPALERLGCRIAVGIFSSAETGNTMRRERLFILAERDVDGAASQRERRNKRSLSGAPNADGTGRAYGGEWHAFDPSAELAFANGGAGAAGGLQRGGQQRFQSEGDGACRQAAGEMARPADTRFPLSREPENRRGIVGHEGLAAGEGSRPALPPAVIPGPSDNRGWIDVLDRWPELQPALSEEEAQSHLRRGIDAMADRVERLRATGNGVDPVVAATAYLRLDALLAAGASANGNVLMEEAA